MIKKKRKASILFIKFAVFFCISLILTACSTTSQPQRLLEGDIGDGGLLTKSPCGPPCFWMINPGITTEEQTIEILRKEGVQKKCAQYDSRSQGGMRGIDCLQSFLIDFDDKYVTLIGFNPSEKITLQQVIREYGEPDYVLAAMSGTPEEAHISMIVYFSKIKTSLVLSEQDGTHFRVSPSTGIENVGYLSNEVFAEETKSLIEWNGYGTYDELAP